jgi:nucleotide-binding universal stress UspA family protein
MEPNMSNDRITRALQDYLRAEQYLSVERSQIDLASRQREAAQRELKSALHSKDAICGHPLAASAEQVLSGSTDLAQVRERVRDYLRSSPEASVKPLIVVGVDSSHPSLWAFAAAGSLAQRLGARILLIHVMDPAALFAPEGYVSQSYYTSLREGAEKVLEAARKLLPAEITVTTIIEEGDPAGKIALLGQERGADYIVVGTHGRGQIGQLLLGSTATAVARLATCPVIVVSHAPASMPALPQQKKFSERLLEKLNPAEVPLD